MNFLSGYKTYIAALGLAGLALYQLSQAQFELAMQSFLAALAAAGLRDAVAKSTPPTQTTNPPSSPSDPNKETMILPIHPVTKLGVAAIAVLILGGQAMASDPATRAKVALALAQAQASCTDAVTEAKPITMTMTYAEARAEAIRQNVPLIVWVGQPAQPMNGAMSVAVDQFDGADGKAVVIGKPDAGDLMRFRTLTGERTASQVRSELDCPDGKCNLPSATGAAGNAAIAAYEYCPTCPGGVRRVR
ncbi:hypothetical protein [Tuwongella immobilis]|uniref:Uncharacterized protein n=1 Tax=Tuwongella immobilis TaxID=692036 RepID=A0A6C2YRM9_9BACT|nr:hypothetical protein [Tuwongella immobilis]VIP03984.1 unnamed protein product [Tuwongella immobilis]VTS05335.1 unnamed protein product [Tuwongella immobilis]